MLAIHFINDKPQRAGPLLDLTMADYEVIRKEGRYETEKFKTAGTYGAAVFLFNEHTVRALELYVEKFRTGPRDPAAALFTTASGAPMDRLSNAMGKFTQEFVDGRVVNITTWRSILATSAADRMSAEDAALMARADLHSSEVVESHYDKNFADRVARDAQATFARHFGSPVRVRSSSSSAVPAGAVVSDVTSMDSSPIGAVASKKRARHIPDDDVRASLRVSCR